MFLPLNYLNKSFSAFPFIPISLTFFNFASSNILLGRFKRLKPLTLPFLTFGHCSFYSSTVSKGKEFEALTVKYLPKICPAFCIQNVGGKGDRGIDFKGHLDFPSSSLSKSLFIPILGQCKAYLNPLTTDDLRSFLGVVSEWNIKNILEQQHPTLALGVFVSKLGYTRSAKFLAYHHSSPMLLLSFSKEENIFLFTDCLLNTKARLIWPQLQTVEYYVKSQRYLNLKLDQQSTSS